MGHYKAIVGYADVAEAMEERLCLTGGSLLLRALRH